jgi:hypothetical protein
VVLLVVAGQHHRHVRRSLAVHSAQGTDAITMACRHGGAHVACAPLETLAPRRCAAGGSR